MKKSLINGSYIIEIMNQKITHTHTHSQTLHRARTIKTKMNTKTVTANSIHKEKKT